MIEHSASPYQADPEASSRQCWLYGTCNKETDLTGENNPNKLFCFYSIVETDN